MRVIVEGEELDVNDDERLLSLCKSRGTRAELLIPSKHKRAACAELIAAIHYGYIKAGAILAHAEMTGVEQLPRDALAQFVDYLRDLIGEGKPRAERINSQATEIITNDDDTESASAPE